MSRWQRLRGFLNLNSVWCMDSWNGWRSIGLAIEIKHFCFFTMPVSSHLWVEVLLHHEGIGVWAHRVGSWKTRWDLKILQVAKSCFGNVKSRVFVFKVDFIAGHVEFFCDWLIHVSVACVQHDKIICWQLITFAKTHQLWSIWRNLCSMFGLDSRFLGTSIQI